MVLGWLGSFAPYGVVTAERRRTAIHPYAGNRANANGWRLRESKHPRGDVLETSTRPHPHQSTKYSPQLVQNTVPSLSTLPALEGLEAHEDLVSSVGAGRVDSKLPILNLLVRGTGCQFSERATDCTRQSGGIGPLQGHTSSKWPKKSALVSSRGKKCTAPGL